MYIFASWYGNPFSTHLLVLQALPGLFPLLLLKPLLLQLLLGFAAQVLWAAAQQQHQQNHKVGA